MYFVIDADKRKVLTDAIETRDEAQKELIRLLNEYRKANKKANLQIIEHDDADQLEDEMLFY